MPTTAAAPATPAPAETRVIFARLRLAFADIKLAHSVFALPFALLGAFLARPPRQEWARFAAQLALVVVCMVAARTWAMWLFEWARSRISSLTGNGFSF